MYNSKRHLNFWEKIMITPNILETFSYHLEQALAKTWHVSRQKVKIINLAIAALALTIAWNIWG